MTLNEAEEKIRVNKHLIGKEFRDQEITNLIIVPAKREKFAEILNDINLSYDYKKKLIGYDQYEIVVLLDFDQYPITGIAIGEELDIVCQSFHH